MVQPEVLDTSGHMSFILQQSNNDNHLGKSFDFPIDLYKQEISKGFLWQDQVEMILEMKIE